MPQAKGNQGKPIEDQDIERNGVGAVRKTVEIPQENLVVFFTAPEDQGAGRNHIETLQRIFREKGYQYEIITDLEAGIAAGADWRKEIDAALDRTAYLVIILSADFLASDFCMDEILPKARALGIQIIPINWRACDSSDLIDPATLIPQGIAICSRPERGAEDQALAEVSSILRAMIVPTHEAAIREGVHGRITNLTQRNTEVVWERSNIPFGRDKNYTGYAYELQKIKSQFKDKPIVVVSGLGGMGKTSIALEYVHRALSEANEAENYQHIFWIEGETEEGILRSFSEIAQILELPCNLSDPKNVVFTVQRWLRKNDKFLLIVDNVEDFDIIQKYLPQNQKGRIIMTSKEKGSHLDAGTIHLEKLDDNSAALLLLKIAGIADQDPTIEALKGKKEFHQAGKIAHELGNLPLALRQAGAYIRETGCTLEQYFDFYKKKGKEMRKKRSTLIGNRYPHSVATTWQLSLESIEEANSGSRELLNFCTFLDPDNISGSLIAAEKPWNEAQTRLETLAVVKRYAFLEGNDKDGYKMHRLVRDVLRDNMDNEEKKKFGIKASKALTRVILARDDFNDIKLTRRIYLSSANICAESIKELDVDQNCFGFLINLAYFKDSIGLLLEAEDLYKRSLKVIEEEKYDASPEQKALVLFGLAGVIFDMEKYEDAIIYLEKAIIEAQKTSDDSLKAKIIGQMGVCYKHLKRFKQAENLIKKALEVEVTIPDTTNIKVINAMCDLADVYYEMGNDEEAKKWLEKAIDKNMEVNEETNIGVIQKGDLPGLHLIARKIFILTTRVEHPPATFHPIEVMCQELQRLYRKASVGTKHYNYNDVLRLLGQVHRFQGRLKEAEDETFLAFNNFKDTYGMEDKETLKTAMCLAEIWTSIEKIEESEALHREILKYSEILGRKSEIDVKASLAQTLYNGPEKSDRKKEKIR